METHTKINKLGLDRPALAGKVDGFIEQHIPRRCMVISTGLFLVGFFIPALAVVQLVPFTFLLGFTGFALVLMGGILAVVFCGEI